MARGRVLEDVNRDSSSAQSLDRAIEFALRLARNAIEGFVRRALLEGIIGRRFWIRIKPVGSDHDHRARTLD